MTRCVSCGEEFEGPCRLCLHRYHQMSALTLGKDFKKYSAAIQEVVRCKTPWCDACFEAGWAAAIAAPRALWHSAVPLCEDCGAGVP